MRTICIFPGRFQLPHTGHRLYYEQLKKEFRTVFVTTSNKKEIFNFKEKSFLLKELGVPEKFIIENKTPYRPLSLLKRFDDSKTAIVYAVGKKDIGRFVIKEDSYFQILQNRNTVKPFSKNSYIYYKCHFKFFVNGKLYDSVSQIRNLYNNIKSDENKIDIFIDEIYYKSTKQNKQRIKEILCKRIAQ